MKAKWFHVTMIAALMVIAVVPIASAAPPAPADPQFGSDVDNASHPLGDRQYAATLRGLEAKFHGKAGDGSIYLDGGDRVYPFYRDRYVELEREGEDTIWTLLGQFGTQVHPTYGDVAGPLHNAIPEPDRAVDNTTIWTQDFSQPMYDKMLFDSTPGANSMRNFYIEQSSGRYAVNGKVEDWVTVPFNEARYGADYCGSIVCATTWLFIRDSASTWYNNQIAAGKTPAEIDAYLSQFDVWDRYDYDGDANFNEPDGYIDHFQAVHAGEGQETGGGAQGTNAIWSHRWYAFYTLQGSAGPAFNLLGGLRVGGSSYWIGDYTVEPENGGVGVFAHEFAHDLGLPDLYDTSGNTGGAENSTGFWTLMSGGSYGASGKAADGIGTKPVHMSAYEKLFLGWSNAAIVNYDETAFLKMGPAEFNSADPQQLLVLLPDKEVQSFIGAPSAGSYYYFSGAGNDLDNSMTREVTLPAAPVSLSAKVNYDIELDWDYAYLTVNGANVHTNLSTNDNSVSGQNLGEGITGASGGWIDLTADLSAYAGQTVTLGFRYWTDVAVAGTGFSVDEIAITSLPVDGGESDAGWTYSGFSLTDGTVTQSYANYYIAEYRKYIGYDKSLKTGPYNFGFLNDPNKGNWVEHYPYQDGLLIWYLDYSFADNNVGDYCSAGTCGGFYLPVDAHSNMMLRPDGTSWRPRVQAFDSTFGVNRVDRICLNVNSVKKCYGGYPGNSRFDDTLGYWEAPNPAIGNNGWSSVPLPGIGVTITVVSEWNGWAYVLVAPK